MNNFSGFNLHVLILLSFAHGITDLSQGAIPVLLPFFKDHFSLSYTQIGLIVLVSNLTACLTQPIFGYLSDKTTAKWLMPVGCFLSALGVGLTGLSPSYAVLLLLIGFSGIGIAAFHPEGSKYTHYASGEKKASGMSIFSVGGNLGYALGSVFVAMLLVQGGLRNTLYLALPGIITAGVLWSRLGRIAAGSKTSAEKVSLTREEKTPFSWQEVRFPLAILLLFIVLRSWIQSGLSTYLPLYYINHLHEKPAYTSYLLSAFLLAGGLGTFLGGPISDRFGSKKLLTGSLLISLPLMIIFPYTSGWLAAVLVVILGGVLVASYSTTVVLGQQMMPNNVGMASGLILGFSFGLGGLGVLFLGNVADHLGILTVFHLLTIFTLLTLGLSLFIREKSPNSSKASLELKAEMD